MTERSSPAVDVDHRSVENAAQETAVDCFRAAVTETLPENVVDRTVSLDGDSLHVDGHGYDLAAYEEVVVVGGGKATPGVADALESLLGDRLSGGVVVSNATGDGKRIERVVGSHPVPNEAGVEGGRRIAELAEAAGEETLLLVVVTGGASALVAAPTEGVSIDELRTTTEALLRSGATIDEMNAVRKHLSSLKGGQLARVASPATVVGLAFSDVVGDDLSVIGSGPTVPDDSTYADALDVVERYDLDLPDAVTAVLRAGRDGERPETPGRDDPAFDTAETYVLVSGRTALEAAAETARDRDYSPLILSSRIRGESREAAYTQAGVVEELLDSGHPVSPPAVVLSGGETTVTVTGDGEGGPNLECALTVALELRESVPEPTERPDHAFLAADTDGEDGGTDHAGALVDARTVSDRATGEAALADNDALPYLDSEDALLFTGPTGTNVNDFRVVVIEASAETRTGGSKE